MSFEKGRAGQSRGVPTACPVSWAGHGAPDHETNRKKRGITPALVEITFHSRAHSLFQKHKRSKQHMHVRNRKHRVNCLKGKNSQKLAIC